MAYDFKTMTPRDLRAALDGPTGDHFARIIAGEALERLGDKPLLLMEGGHYVEFVSCRNPVKTVSRKTVDYGNSVIETITETTATEYRK